MYTKIIHREKIGYKQSILKIYRYIIYIMCYVSPQISL